MAHGLDFYGEQGIEGIHSEFNLQAEHAKKEDVRLRQIMVNNQKQPVQRWQEISKPKE